MHSIEHDTAYYTAIYHDLAQREVPEERVLAAGALSRPGAMGNTLLGHVSWIASRVVRFSNKRLSGNLPQNVVVAVTPTRVLFFGYTLKARAVVITELTRVILRDDVRVEVFPGKLATRLTFQCRDGSSFQLDSNCGLGQHGTMNDGLFAALGAPRTQ